MWDNKKNVFEGWAKGEREREAMLLPMKQFLWRMNDRWINDLRIYESSTSAIKFCVFECLFFFIPQRRNYFKTMERIKYEFFPISSLMRRKKKFVEFWHAQKFFFCYFLFLLFRTSNFCPHQIDFHTGRVFCFVNFSLPPFGMSNDIKSHLSNRKV